MESNRVYTLQLDECIKIKDTVQSLWDTPKNLQQEPVLTLALDFTNIKWFQTKLHIQIRIWIPFFLKKKLLFVSSYLNGKVL